MPKVYEVAYKSAIQKYIAAYHQEHPHMDLPHQQTIQVSYRSPSTKLPSITLFVPWNTFQCLMYIKPKNSKSYCHVG